MPGITSIQSAKGEIEMKSKPSPAGMGFARRLSIAGIAAACLMYSAPSFAYVLEEVVSCEPFLATGSPRWPSNEPVKVYWLSESFSDYVAVNKSPSQLLDLSNIIKDIEAVVDEYNSVAGSSLTLEFAGSIIGDRNLEEYDADTFDSHAIVIGFTDLTATSNEDAPAWSPKNPDDGCWLTRRHVLFRKNITWTFGAPETTDVNGKSFGGGTSFRAVLLHEMGHAIGLAHETDTYAVMIHGTKAWTRGLNDEPQMELLPDDINGLHALYGNGRQEFDVSVTNTWFMSAAARTEYNVDNNIRHAGCNNIEDSLDELLSKREVLQGAGRAKVEDELEVIEKRIDEEKIKLWECHYREDTAAQTQNCKVSSRGDDYADPADQAVLCGVISSSTVNSTVCPGGYLQLRYSVNNKSGRNVRLQQQVWLSVDDNLEVNGAARDLRSADVHEFDLNAGYSASIGRIYRVPANTPDGADYRVYVRVIPYDISSGQSLWVSDEDQWNNSIRVRGSIDVDSASCSRSSS
jgi:hypothetical protein